MSAVSVPRLRQLCDDATMLELWQAEWCPYSHRVRLRLTELDLDWIARTIPVGRTPASSLLPRPPAFRS